MKMEFAQVVNKGMQRDYAMNTASQEFAYENKNIRITTTGNESFLSVTNEKSTQEITLIFDDGSSDLDNLIILGSATINNNLILFCTLIENPYDVDPDYIYKVTIDPDVDEGYVTTLYHGNLKFNINNPIECTTYYESDNVQKVYWVDGLNQPRVINTCIPNQNDDDYNLDFVPRIDSNIKVSVEKQYEGKGVFPSGVIQYYITYYNKFGQESNAVHITPLYSISPIDRGGVEDEVQTCSFKLRIEDVDTKYDYIRVYSFIRTTINADSIVSIVGDLNINKENKTNYYEIIDDNYGNINVPSTDILFLGGNTISASTIEQKDNTLFLGNISSISNNDDYTELKKELENNRAPGNNDGLTFVSRPIESKQTSNTDYGYAPNMDLSSKDRGFKYLEYYRFGLQFQNDTGEWGNTLWLNDKQNHLRPDIVEYDENEDTIIKEMYDNADNFHSLAAVKYKPNDDVKNIIKNYNSKYYRLVMAEHNNLSRTIKTQGIVMPTLFNLKQRKDGTCFGSPVWSTGILRNNLYHYDNIDLLTYTTEGDDYYLNVHPAQQLDSTLYKIKDGYTIENGHTVPDGKGKALFKILPSATISAETIKNNEYLERIEIEIEVYRENPANFHSGTPLSSNDKKAAWDSPRGQVLQDMFFFRIKPFTMNSSTNVIEEKPTYTLREFRLAGKVKNTVDFLITQMAGKTWKDYREDEEVLNAANGADLDFINSSQPILNKAEIITAEKFNEERKTSVSRPSYKYKERLIRNGDLDINLQLTDEFKNQYFIDANSCNLWCPNVSEITESNANFRIVGALEVNNTISDYKILTEGNVIGGTTYTNYEHNFNRYDFYSVKTGITSYPLWPGISTKTMYWVFPWNQNVILNHVSSGEGDVGYKISLKNKTFANLWKTNSNFLETPVEYGTIYYKVYSDSPVYYKGDLYEGKPQNVLFPATNRRSYIYSNKGLTSTTEFETIEEVIKNNNTFIQKEADGVNSSVNIKYSSTDHLFFNLGTINGFNNVLPTYNIPTSVNYGGNIDITDNTNYPTTRQKIDYKLEGNPGDIEDFLALAKEEQKLTDSTVSALFKFVEDAANYPIVYYFIVSMIGDTPVNLTLYFSEDEFFKFLDLADFVKLGNYSVLCGDSVLSIKNVELEDENTQRYIINFAIKSIKEAFTTYSEDLVYLNNNGNVQKLFENNNYKITLDNPNPSDNKKVFIGEFYVPYDPSTFMGGNTENALELNTFIPISDPTPIGETIYGFEGDTYYQQWDCLRIYPTSEEDVNKVVDVVSAMIETHTNLDGDTRKARGRSDMINVRPDNMVNQINPIYSQSNNYITSKILDEKHETSKHPLQYWWSLSKNNMSDIDNWTGVNLTSIAELDGDKGPLNKIKRWNNYLFAFQDKGIAQINFNNQTTLSTQEGLPVEISNSGKVQGHYYITNNYGCKNKWSITETPSGLYFIDSYNKSIMVLGEGIKSISQLNLFEDWIEQNEQGNVWNPNRVISAFKSFYDPIRQEVYFVNGDYCLCYNELLQQFTSFYDYESLNYMFLIDNHIYGINKDNLIHKMFEGNDYCKLFRKQCDYYMQYKVNHNPLIDKTWTNLEYRADIFNNGNIQSNKDYANDTILSDKTFDSLKVWNEYQSGELDLTKTKFNYLKDARSRFRVWRTNIPRANKSETNKYGLDRIRNPWIMLELKKNKEDSKERMEFHDLVIKYVI